MVGDDERGRDLEIIAIERSVMTVRVTRATRAALEEIASAQGRRLADVSRDALDEYVGRHTS